MKPLFTPEELAELAAFDAEIDDEPLSAQDYRDSARRDKDAVFAEKGTDERRKVRVIAAYQREYREANKEQIAAKKSEYMLNRRANREDGIGDMIREARKRAGMDQKMLAVMAGIYQPQLSNYERNLIVPTKPILIRIADALGVSLETMTTTKGA